MGICGEIIDFVGICGYPDLGRSPLISLKQGQSYHGVIVNLFNLGCYKYMMYLTFVDFDVFLIVTIF